MNQISETNVIETEASELQALAAMQAEEAFAELSASQLLLVGGGSGTAILT